MKQIVIMPGGFHPFHAGHYALYKSALEAFPQADVYVAATNDQSERPFPFSIKEKLAKLAGVAPGRFVQVKSPFQAKEITQNYNPEEDVLIFVRSEKDRNEQPKPGGTKKDGSPAYFQPWTGKNLQPFSKHAYIAYLPTVTFGPGIQSATEIRKAWPTLDDRRKTAMVMSLYPATQKNPKLAANVVKMLDMGMGEQQGVAEGWKDAVVGGAMALGALGAGNAQAADLSHFNTQYLQQVASGEHPRPMVSVDDAKAELQARANGKQQSVTTPAKSEEPKGFSKEYLQKAADPNRFGRYLISVEKAQELLNKMQEGVAEGLVLDEDAGNKLADQIVDALTPVVKNVHKEKVPDYVDQARELLSKSDDPTVRKRLLDIFKTGKENPYLQGGIITTVGALLAGGILNTSQSMGLTPQQTNIALQAILNTVIPTLVSRINGRNWKDTIKYTLASAGVGTGIATITENEDYLEEK